MIRAELLRDGDDALVKRLTFDDNWVFQEKHNGDRRLVEKQGLAVRDFNRNGQPGKGLPPALTAVLRQHPVHRFVLDTELVGGQVHLFDALCCGDEILAARPYSYRELTCHAQFSGYDRILPVRSARTPEEKIALIKRLRGENAEGFVMKDLRAPYRPGERWNYRYKFWKSLDAVVIGDSTKRVEGKLRDSVRLGCYDKKGRLKDICGSTKKSAFTLLPGDVVEVKYLYGTGTLDIVQPTILRKRADKAPQECLLSQVIVNKNWRRA